MRRLVLVLAAAALAGCGGGSKPETSTTAAPDVAGAMRALVAKDPSLAGTVRTLFQGSAWALVQTTADGEAHAVAFHLVDSKWVPDRSARVRMKILGPQPGATTSDVPQVAIGFASKLPFVETGLWIDGTELFAKGGGSPTRGTIYAAPKRPLKAGEHVAVGYARNVAQGSAVAWVFKVG